MSKTSDLVRKMFLEADEVRDDGLSTPETIERFDNIIYGEADPKLQSLDVYRPKGVNGKLPVIVSVHGGGWVYGDKDRYQFYCMELASYGFAVINFSYRLAPEYKFPAPAEDTNTVFTWMLDHADEYGFDTDNVFAVGDSAGANLLGIYAAALCDSLFASVFEFKIPQDLKLNAIGLHCGAYLIDLEGETSFAPTADLIRDLMPNEGTPKELDLLTVINHITSEYPPTYFMTSNKDFLRNDAPVLSIILFEHDVPFEFRYFGGKEFLNHVFHLDIRKKAAKQANDALIFFFRQYMKNDSEQ